MEFVLSTKIPSVSSGWGELPEVLPELEDAPAARYFFVEVYVPSEEREGVFFFRSSFVPEGAVETLDLLLYALNFMRIYARLPVVPIHAPARRVGVKELSAVLFLADRVAVLAPKWLLLVRGADGWWLHEAPSTQQLKRKLLDGAVPYAALCDDINALLTAVMDNASLAPPDYTVKAWGELGTIVHTVKVKEEKTYMIRIIP